MKRILGLAVVMVGLVSGIAAARGGAVTAVFALYFAAGRIVGPVGSSGERPSPVQEHGSGGGDGH